MDNHIEAPTIYYSTETNPVLHRLQRVITSNGEDSEYYESQLLLLQDACRTQSDKIPEIYYTDRAPDLISSYKWSGA